MVRGDLASTGDLRHPLRINQCRQSKADFSPRLLTAT
jgi:hypothetical protein